LRSGYPIHNIGKTAVSADFHSSSRSEKWVPLSIMPHEAPLIVTIVAGLGLAFVSTPVVDLNKALDEY
jgi:hypothetical protein